MDTLFDLENIPTKTETVLPPSPVYKYYLRGKRADGKTYILWKTHDGEADYYPEDEPNGRKPRFWNSLKAAQRARKIYGGSVEVLKVDDGGAS